MELHLNRLLDEYSRILIDHDIRVKLVDGEVLGEGRRNKKDEAEVEDEDKDEKDKYK